MITLRGEVLDPRFGIILEDVGRSIGSERIGMHAKRGEGKSEFTHPTPPDGF